MKWVTMALLLLAPPLQDRIDWEPNYAAAAEKAKKEGRPIVAAFYSGQLKVLKSGEGLLAKCDDIKHCIFVKFDIDKGLPPGWNQFVTKDPRNMYSIFGGGVAVVSPSGDTGMFLYELQLQSMTHQQLRAWMVDSVQQVLQLGFLTPAIAEWKAISEGRPLLVLSGYDALNAIVFRDPILAGVMKEVVLLCPSSDYRRFMVRDSPGGCLFDPSDRSEIVSFKWPKTAKKLVEILEEPTRTWALKEADRRKKLNKEMPFVCGFCGFRSRESDTCCGESLASFETPVWEKSYDAARARAVADRRVVAYFLLKHEKDFTTLQEMMTEPMLAALSGRAVFFAETVADAGDRAGEFKLESGIAILSRRPGTGDLFVQARLESADPESFRRELAKHIRRLKYQK